MNNPVGNNVGTDQEKKVEEDVINEFGKVKNEDVHELVQQRIFALKRNVTVAKSPTDFLGSDVRESLIPLIQNVLRGVINLMNEGCKEFNILDVMPGKGTQVDWFLAQELELTLRNSKENNLYLIESNPEFINSYKQTVKNYAHLKFVKSYNGKVKEYYQKSLDTKVDFIMCMDLCFLTDYSERSIDPQKDITDFVKFLYGQLRPGGAIFITYLDLESKFSQINFDYIKDTTHQNNIKKIAKAREDLLYNGDIVNKLNSDGKSCPKVESHKLSTFYYAKSLAEVAVMSLDGGFVKNNKDKFEIEHLKSLIKKVKEVNEIEPQKGQKRPFGLCRAERGRDPLWRVESLQYVCIIRKEK
ncbi:14253_t:CDS:2 [Cetraspora pellucida]|uniref:14253_t:CDS:1 n=1 Tax=Cetraspora pellucida TaxID=1433469 RepID=A0A9N9J3T9_9GLOM|nr:14253_t:CDS:2 [Cetraspora pellucida]